MNRRRRRLVVVATTAALLVGAGAVAASRRAPGCGEDVVSRGAAASRTPFLDAERRREQPDHDRDTLVTALAAAPAPFGEVQGAVGYHYEQWARLSAFARGVGIRTRDNPDFTLLDDTTLRPRWSVDVRSARSSYDASDRTYLVATRHSGRAPDLVSLDLATGTRRWCATLGGPAVRPSSPFATQFLAGDDVVVLGPGRRSDELRVTRRSGSDGAARWTRSVVAGRGDFVGDAGDGVVVAGGSAQFHLADPAALARRTAGPAVVGLAASDGRTRWTWRSRARSDVHVVGTDAGTGLTVLMQTTAGDPGGRLLALDRSGREVWSVAPSAGTFFDAALRSDRVLVRSGERWSAYAVGGGGRLWSVSFPSVPQLLPYGFSLDGVPLLDDDHALLGTTTALRVLDLATGALGPSAPLPTDGVATTYWPYALVVTPHHLALATNTGAVVLRR